MIPLVQNMKRPTPIQNHFATSEKLLKWFRNAVKVYLPSERKTAEFRQMRRFKSWIFAKNGTNSRNRNVFFDFLPVFRFRSEILLVSVPLFHVRMKSFSGHVLQ